MWIWVKIGAHRPTSKLSISEVQRKLRSRKTPVATCTSQLLVKATPTSIHNFAGCAPVNDGFHRQPGSQSHHHKLSKHPHVTNTAMVVPLIPMLLGWDLHFLWVHLEMRRVRKKLEVLFSMEKMMINHWALRQPRFDGLIPRESWGS